MILIAVTSGNFNISEGFKFSPLIYIVEHLNSGVIHIMLVGNDMLGGARFLRGVIAYSVHMLSEAHTQFPTKPVSPMYIAAH